jgi:hypothetical protein
VPATDGPAPFIVERELWLERQLSSIPTDNLLRGSPSVAPALHVLARILAEVGRTEDEDLKALLPALVASPRANTRK